MEGRVETKDIHKTNETQETTKKDKTQSVEPLHSKEVHNKGLHSPYNMWLWHHWNLLPELCQPHV